MNQYQRLYNVIKNPYKLVPYLSRKRMLNWVTDETYLKLVYKARMEKKLNLDNPKSYNEKLQWLKLHDRNPLYTQLVDKYEVRKYIDKVVGEEYLIPLIGVYDKFEDIDFNKLPNQFVLKCTHDSGGLIICKDKGKLDIDDARKKINYCLNKNFYYHGREWPYKNVAPRIICEEYMVDESKTELKDYKFFCFNGKPKALFIATDRNIDTKFDFFDMEFNHMSFMQHYKNSEKQICKPKGFDEMVRLAKILSKDIPHVRIDFYDINGKIYFGEFTFYHFSGLEKFEPESYDELFGKWIILPKMN